MITILQYTLVIIYHRFKNLNQSCKRSKIQIDINSCLIRMMKLGKSFKNLLILDQIQQLTWIQFLKMIDRIIKCNLYNYQIDSIMPLLINLVLSRILSKLKSKTTLTKTTSIILLKSKLSFLVYLTSKKTMNLKSFVIKSNKLWNWLKNNHNKLVLNCKHLSIKVHS